MHEPWFVKYERDTGREPWAYSLLDRPDWRWRKSGMPPEYRCAGYCPPPEFSWRPEPHKRASYGAPNFWQAKADG